VRTLLTPLHLLTREPRKLVLERTYRMRRAKGRLDDVWGEFANWRKMYSHFIRPAQ